MALSERGQFEFLAGTVLGIAPMRNTVLLVAFLATVLFTSIEPECSAGLSLLPRFLFWSLQIGTGMSAIMLASVLLRMAYPRPLSFPVLIVVSAMFGAMLACPLFVGLEGVFDIRDADDMAVLQNHGFAAASFSEFIAIVPSFITVWALANFPILMGNTQVNQQSPHDSSDENLAVRKASPHSEGEPEQGARQSFLDSLPELVGRDLVAVSSDLHYLNVHTSLGKTVVLGSVSRWAEAFGEEGMMVHRANWVAKKHVTRVVINGNNAYCLMSTGLKVPVSRSRRKDVKSVFGGGVKLHSDATLA
ncbi:LytTr DNA-binding domain-containing protein [Alteromonadaceae bacterium 2753L.S.0a.02]|nr:LytTr DNA-binding domain-containing protein [Alteromonadaceae bacterium 2753L.S.0a.02]